MVTRLKHILVGWANYFCLGRVWAAYRLVDTHGCFSLNGALSVLSCTWFPNGGVGQEVMRWCVRHKLGSEAAAASEGLLLGR